MNSFGAIKHPHITSGLLMLKVHFEHLFNYILPPLPDLVISTEPESLTFIEIRSSFQTLEGPQIYSFVASFPTKFD